MPYVILIEQAQPVRFDPATVEGFKGLGSHTLQRLKTLVNSQSFTQGHRACKPAI